MTNQPKHVFISYVRENQDQVDRLCQDLERHGVNVWLDRKYIKPGARWKDAIREAIRHGSFFIACFSDEYTSKTKSYMNEELTLATEELRQYASDREWFIPVLLSECDVPARRIGPEETLKDINWVPLHEDWDAGIQKILSVIKPIPPEIQKLISTFRSENVDVHHEAAEALRKIGPEAKAAVPALIEALKAPKEWVRRQAADTLGYIGLDAKATVPALIEALKDPEDWVRQQAADTLGYIGPKAKAAVPALIEALKDQNEYVGYRAAMALGYIGGLGVKEAVPVLIEALNGSYPKFRWRAAEALRKINTPETQKALKEYYKKSE